MTFVESIKLNDGRHLPMVGLGTFRVLIWGFRVLKWVNYHSWIFFLQAVDEESVYTAVKTAVQAGYRHFDCAWLYKNEAIIGRALKDCIAESNGSLRREDVFLVSKVWNTFHSEAQVEVALNETLRDLQVDYIDLYLIHWPMGFKVRGTVIRGWVIGMFLKLPDTFFFVWVVIALSI